MRSFIKSVSDGNMVWGRQVGLGEHDFFSRVVDSGNYDWGDILNEKTRNRF
jgi:hypothetical protein